jgi:hypothetical protein
MQSLFNFRAIHLTSFFAKLCCTYLTLAAIRYAEIRSAAPPMRPRGCGARFRAILDSPLQEGNTDSQQSDVAFTHHRHLR